VLQWFTKELVPGRRPLGWFSWCIALAASAAMAVGLLQGWPSWRFWALFGLSQAALATCWYARGRMDALRAICGGMGVILVLWNLVLAR
jgi:hypothetical protein